AGVLARPADFEPDVVIVSLGVPPARLQAIAELLALVPFDGDFRLGRTFPPPPARQEPFTYKLNMELRDWLYFDRLYGATCDVVTQLFRDNTVLDFASPVPFTRSGYTQLRITEPSLARL